MSESISYQKKKRKRRHKSKHKLADKQSNQVHDISVDADSDPESPRKPVKKKKKIVAPTDSSGKKIKSIRQLKREKFAERQDAVKNESKEQIKRESLSYLSQWKHDKSNWKFMKVKQAWLYKNKFSNDLIPDEYWQSFLQYFSSAQGNVKKMLLDDANKVIAKMDECSEKYKELELATPEKDESQPNTVMYQRARDIIQNIDE